MPLTLAPVENTPYIGGNKPGFLSVSAAGKQVLLKNNLNATVDPTSTDGASEGYSIGSRWINVSTDKVFECVDNTILAAIWKDLSSTTNPGGSPTNLQYYDPAGGFAGVTNSSVSGANVTLGGTLQTANWLLSSDGNGALLQGSGGAGNLTIKDQSGDVVLYKSASGSVHLGGVAGGGDVVIQANTKTRFNPGELGYGEVWGDGGGFYLIGAKRVGISSNAGFDMYLQETNGRSVGIGLSTAVVAGGQLHQVVPASTVGHRIDLNATPGDAIQVNSSGGSGGDLFKFTTTRLVTGAAVGLELGNGVTVGSDHPYIRLKTNWGDADIKYWGHFGIQAPITTTGYVRVNSDQMFQFSSDAAFSTGPDTALGRNAAGVVEINNGTAGQYRDLIARKGTLRNDAGTTEYCLNLGGSFQQAIWNYTVNNAPTTYALNFKATSELGNVWYYFDVLSDAVTYSNTLVLNRNRVGIGVASPGATLDVTGASGQTANLSQWNPNGVTAGTRARITSAGEFSNNQGNANAEAFGAGATAAASCVAVGTNAAASSVGVAIGFNATTNAQSTGVAIGAFASASLDCVAIGAISVAALGGSVAIGKSASAGRWSVAIGESASNGGFNDAAIAIGKNSTNTAGNQFVCGSSSLAVSDIYFGKGVSDATPTAYTIHGTNSSGAAAGGDVRVVGGSSVSGTAGNVILAHDGSAARGVVTVGAATSVGGSKLNVSGSLAVGDDLTDINLRDAHVYLGRGWAQLINDSTGLSLGTYRAGLQRDVTVSASTGNVLIGTATDAGAKLYVSGGDIFHVNNGNSPRYVIGDNLAGSWGVIQWISATDALNIEGNTSGSSVTLQTNYGGNVLIGTTTNDGTNKLQVNGNITIPANSSYRIDGYRVLYADSSDTFVGNLDTNRPLKFYAGATNCWTMNTSGHLLAATNNTYNIGDAAGLNRPANLYVAGFADASSYYVDGSVVLDTVSTRLLIGSGGFTTFTLGGTGDPLLQFGGTTSSFPAIARSLDELHFTLASSSSTLTNVRAKTFGNASNADPATNVLNFSSTAQMRARLGVDSTSSNVDAETLFIRQRSGAYNLSAGDYCGAIDWNTMSWLRGIATGTATGGFSTIDLVWDTTNAAGVRAERIRFTAEGNVDLSANSTLSFGGTAQNYISGVNSTGLFFGTANTARWKVDHSGHFIAQAGTYLIKWGETSSFPALKRSSTLIQFRDASDAGYTSWESAGWFTYGSTASTIKAAFRTNDQLCLGSDVPLVFSSTTDATGLADAKVVRHTTAQVGVYADSGLAVRNLANSAYAPFDCKTLTIAGTGTSKGRLQHTGDGSVTILTSNALWTGAAWNRDDITRPAWRSYLDSSGDEFVIERAASGANPISWTNLVRIANTGNVGIGTGATTPSALIHGIKTTEQLRLGYDVSNYYSTTVSSAGVATFDAVSGGVSGAGTLAILSAVELSKTLTLKNLGGDFLITNSGGTDLTINHGLSTVFSLTDAGVLSIDGLEIASGGLSLPGAASLNAGALLDITVNSLAAAQFDDSSAGGETRLLLFDVDSGALKRVRSGANNSGPGGAGRALYIDNA